MINLGPAKLVTIVIVSFLATILPAQNEITIRVYPHIIRNNDGNGGITNQQLEESKTILDNVFNPHGIYFEYECTNYIYDTDIYLDPAANVCIGLMPFWNNDGIDMFLGPDTIPGTGRASSIPGDAFALSGFRLNSCSLWENRGQDSIYFHTRSPILAHEMGHLLGLFHTFENDPGSNAFLGCPLTYYNSCDEYMIGDNCGGPNCEDCGDKVCDTPADRENMDFDPCTCQQTSNFYDTCGDLIIPNGHNIMSYSPLQCQNHITEGQAERIKSVMANSPFVTSLGTSGLCEGTFCCDTINKQICIGDDQCDGYFSDHCPTCTVEWITPPGNGSANCVRIEDNPNFIYEAIISQTIGGTLYTSTIQGTIADFCSNIPYYSPHALIHIESGESSTMPINYEDMKCNVEIFTLSGQKVASMISVYEDALHDNSNLGLQDGLYILRYFSLEGEYIKTEKKFLFRQ